MNKIRVTIEGDGRRALYRLTRSHIALYDICVDTNSISMTISDRDYRHVSNILDDISVTYHMTKTGFREAMTQYMSNRCGIVLGAIIMIIATLIMSNCTWNIEVRGNILVPTNVIIEAIDKSDTRYGHLSDKDKHNIEDIVMNASDLIAYVSTRREGTRLVIDIRERLSDVMIESLDKGCVIANSDGIVTRVNVIDGTARVKAGDTVKCGDVLIDPYVSHGDGEEETRRDTTAVGEVYARCYLSEDIVIHEGDYYYIPTGREKTLTRLSRREPKSPYERYSLRRETGRIYGILPLRYTRYTFSELKIQEYDLDDKELRERLLSHAYSRLNNRVIEDEKILNKWFFEKRLDNTRIISVYYEVEKLISGGKRE